MNNKKKIVSVKANGFNIRRDSVEAIFPFVMEEKKDRIESGGNYERVIAFTSYPEEAEGNWLSELKRIKGNVTITQHINPTDSYLMTDYYNKAIKNKDAEKKKTFDPKRLLELENEIESAKYQLSQAVNNKSGFVEISTYVLIQATSEAELDKLENKIMMILNKLHIRGVVPYRRMKDAFFSSLPLFENNLYDYTYSMTNTAAASSFFLFDDNELCNLVPGTTVEGYNDKTNSFVAIDYNNKKKAINRNKFVCGTSGSGKSTYLKDKIMPAIAKGFPVYIIDPENEFTNIVKMYGGTVLDFGVSSKTIINPYEFFSNNVFDESENSYDIHVLIKQKIQRLKGFWKQIKSDITEVELSCLDKINHELYKEKGTVSKEFEKLQHEDFPILEDLYLKIGKLKDEDEERYNILKDFYFILYSHVYGADAIFNGYTNIDMNNDVISFNLMDLQLEKSVQGACYYNIFQYLWDRVVNSFKAAEVNHVQEFETLVVADEFHFLLKNEESCDFFFQAYKRFRKYKAGAVVATQQLQEILDAQYSSGKIGDAILQNSFTKIFFGFEDRGVEDITARLKIRLSNKELNLLKAKEQGKALLIHGNKRVFLNVRLGREELRLINPEEYFKRYEKDPEVPIDYVSKIRITPIEKVEIETMGGGR